MVQKSQRKGKVFDNTRQVIEVITDISGVARICCEKGQRWKLCHHGALAADFGARCSSCSMTVTNAVLIERAVTC